jgi:hypothetical protein
MMSARMILPNLTMILRATGNRKKRIEPDCFDLRTDMKRYIAHEREQLAHRRAVFSKLAASRQPVYAWGIGREFLYLYRTAGLMNCNVVGLIDMNRYKRENLAIDGRRIADASILHHADPGSVVVISAVAHRDVIKQALLEVGFRGQCLEL